MNKKLLVLAVAAALPMMGAAQADVTIYGKAHVSIDFVDPSFTHSNDYWDVTSRASRLGFKGDEDLGNGLKLIWKMESQIDMASAGTYWKPRNTYIGLAGGWGTFLYGRHDTPAKMSTGKLDIFGDEMGDYNAVGKIIDVRADDAIAYVSPSMGGLTLAGAVIPDGDYEGQGPDQGDFAGGYSLAAMYSNGGLYLAGAWESLDDLNITGKEDLEHWRIGAGFDMAAFHIGAIYQDADFGSSAAGDFDSWLINGSYAFGNGKIKAEWGQIDNSDKTDAWAIGYDHNMSKRTKMYVQYADSEHGLQDVNFSGVDQSGLSLGMVHNF